MLSEKRDRSVAEIYNATELIGGNQIVQVSQGSFLMQGPVDEKDHSTQTNMVSPQVEKRYGKRSMNRRGRMIAESGTCNVCSAPCSSCMHLNRAHTGPKTEEVSDSHYSVNAGDVKGRACESIQHTASEASNILSINSSHDSLSENAESKATVRSSNIPDPLEDIKPHLKFTSGKIGAVDQLTPETEHILEQGKTSSEFVDSQGMEGHDDNISCVSRASGANAVVSSSTRDVENKIDSLENGSKGVDADGSSPVIDSSKGHSECGGHLIGGNSEVSMKAEPNSEAEVDKDGGKSPDEVMKGSDQAEKSSELAELPDMQEPPSRAESETESDESNILEHDVKVCDICGDAGREDLLATCSRCSDGAEHTYCMKEMIQKVPEGDWLCEECKFAEESESQRQGSDAEEKRASKGSSSMQNSSKRRAESLEVASSAKRQAIEASFGSLKSPSITRAAALSREASFKSLDKGKMRLTHSGNQSGSDTPESARSSTMSPRLMTLKSTLTKSNSFSTSSSKQKVKLVDEVRQQKLRGTKELSLKEPPTKVVGKSTSFKSPNSLNSSESKSKMLPSKSSHVQDLKGWKHMKDRNSFERKPVPKLDRSLTCSAMGTSTVSTPRTFQKLTPRGETNSLFHTSNRRESKVWQSDGKPSTLTKSNSNSRKGVEHPVSSVGASPGNGICSSSEEKLSQVNTKDEHLTMPKTAALCQKCKEVGRAVENCSLCSLQTSGTDVTASRTSRNEINKTNDLKAAIEAAIQKVPRKFAKNKAPDKSDGFAVPTLDVNCEKASQNQPFSNKMKTAVSGEGTYEGKLSLQRRASDFHIQPMINNAKQLNDHAIDSFELRDSDRVVSSAGKPMMEDWPLVSSVIPEHEYIWQGAFEVDRAGKHDLCGGIQAHLSTGSSPKVLEVVNKFSYKMQLMEVPRLSSWPTHFQSCGAKEDNIALYFFAKDIESYEKTYKVLVDNMIKSDLALIANFEGVELLIFPSNLLPEDCQRWNMLYFLWGVFKVGKVVSSNLLKSPMAQLVNKELSLHDDSNTAVISNISNKTPVIINRDCGNKVSLLEQTTIVLQENSENDDSVPSTKLLSNIEPGNDKIRSEARCTTPSLEEDALPESETRTDVKPFLEATGTNICYDRADKRNTPVSVSVGESVKEILFDRTNGDRRQLKDKSVKVEDEFTDTGTVSECEKELNPLQPSRQKRPRSDLDETATRTSPGFTPKIPLDDLNCVFVDDDDDSVSKKLKTGCSSGDANFVAPVKDVGCSSFVDFKLQDKARDEEVIIIPEDTETGEGSLYPVKSGRVDDFQSGDNLKRQDRESWIPNLNLAFGDETDPPELVLSDKSMDEKDLSLSLSFPFPDKEQNPKPVSETEPKSWPGDTSVFLFGNILKK